MLRHLRARGARRIAASAVLTPLRACRTTTTAPYSYQTIRSEDSLNEVRAWVEGVEVGETALQQLRDLSRMPPDVIRHPIAVMADVHGGIGCTVGTVIPTSAAIIPASVGVDIGCGMFAVETTLTAEMLPDSLEEMRLAIELAVPHGRSHGGRPDSDAGSWRQNKIPDRVADVWKRELADGFDELCRREKGIRSSNHVTHLGTLGTGNHFIEVCLDDSAPKAHVWVMLHSGSRGVGNRIGSLYIEKAKRDMESVISRLPNADLAYLKEGTQHFKEYMAGVEWAQKFALLNRQLMMTAVLEAVRSTLSVPFQTTAHAINCHHNYVERFQLPGEEAEMVWLTRKGATSARAGELAVIPGSMGARSYIVRGKGNAASYCSCSHGAGRRFSRGEARRRFTLEDHIAATAGVECRKDASVLDETPAAYKDIDAVMKAQEELVEVVATLHQVLCVKG